MTDLYTHYSYTPCAPYCYMNAENRGTQTFRNTGCIEQAMNSSGPHFRLNPFLDNWNRLPLAIRQAESVAVFKSSLKTYLFTMYFEQNHLVLFILILFYLYIHNCFTCILFYSIILLHCICITTLLMSYCITLYNIIAKSPERLWKCDYK